MSNKRPSEEHYEYYARCVRSEGYAMYTREIAPGKWSIWAQKEAISVPYGSKAIKRIIPSNSGAADKKIDTKS